MTTCNLCHPSGGGSTPVLTYWSGPGGGFGCAGCHGQNYGETSPNSGQPKATAYGLRQFHVNQGVTACGTPGCHQPGALGAPNPFPPLFPENVPPPYYGPAFSNLTDPCSSSQEDLPLRSSTPSASTTTATGFADCACGPRLSGHARPRPPPTPTLGVDCGTAPAIVCIAPGKGSLLVDEKKPGKEKLKVTLTKLQPAVTQSAVRRSGQRQHRLQDLHLRRAPTN